MKKSILLGVMLVLSTITLSSCEELFDELWDFGRYGAKEISGPWLQDGYEISYIGGGEYEIWESGKPRPRYEYLGPFYNYTASVPRDTWPMSYKPYYDTFYGSLCWYVYDKYGNDFLIFKNGNYMYI